MTIKTPSTKRATLGGGLTKGSSFLPATRPKTRQVSFQGQWLNMRRETKWIWVWSPTVAGLLFLIMQFQTGLSKNYICLKGLSEESDQNTFWQTKQSMNLEGIWAWSLKYQYFIIICNRELRTRFSVDLYSSRIKMIPRKVTTFSNNSKSFFSLFSCTS